MNFLLQKIAHLNNNSQRYGKYYNALSQYFQDQMNEDVIPTLIEDPIIFSLERQIEYEILKTRYLLILYKDKDKDILL